MDAKPINESQEAAFDAALAGNMDAFLAALDAESDVLTESAKAAQKANAAVIEG